MINNPYPIASKRTIIDEIDFDSKTEAMVYKELKRILPTRYSLILQYPVLLKPKTKLFSEIIWHCDFAIFKNEVLIALLEVKGSTWNLDRNFRFKMKILELINPHAFNKLFYIVANDSKKARNLHCPIINFDVKKSKFKDIEQLTFFSLRPVTKTKLQK
jgi:hypothetical protein